MIWCPYTDFDIEKLATSPEHIIPLALGGSNGFVVPVDAKFNSLAGLEIDGPLANDFATLIRRRKFDMRGHSGRPPKATAKKAQFGPMKRPVQVTFRGKQNLLVWDAIDRRYLDEAEVAGELLSLSLEIKWFVRLRFLAKVALAAGFYMYEDLFRQHVDHRSLRELMWAKTSDEALAALRTSGLRGYYEFSEINPNDVAQVEMEKGMCEAISGSCVVFALGPSNLGITVGVLGQWIGTLNVPAKTDDFPMDEANDLGRAVVLVNGLTEKFSYREFCRYVLEQLKKVPAGSDSSSGGLLDSV